MQSAIRLFKAVPITQKGKAKASRTLLKETIKRGFVFSPEVIFNYSQNELDELIKQIEIEFVLTPEGMNSAFHKSWKKIKKADIEVLVLEQILHYITTYGAERAGIYDKDLVYIPDKVLKIPKIKIDKINLIIIKGYTKEELKNKILNLLESGIALKEDTKKDVIDVITYIGLGEDEIDKIRNKEVKCALYDYMDLIPKEPVEFLRFMIYKSTNKTLLIKDKTTIEEIKSKDNLYIINLLDKYQKKYGLEKFAEIFLRFKPIWLAFRTNKGLKTIINRIRKLANKYHKPMVEDYLNSVTAKIKNSIIINSEELKKELRKVNVFRKIRLAYALQFRTQDAESILYRIRNGKSYATDFHFDKQSNAKKVLSVVLNSISKDIEVKVKDKKIYIPNNIIYTLPATEKQFTGNFPSGTCITVSKDMVMGINWKNVKNNRIDLDLSLINCEHGKIGWDCSYRTDTGDVLFSGDMTDAPGDNGASELFYIQRQKAGSYILLVNYYNYDKKIEVPFSIIIASEQVKNMKQNYMVNPNNVISIVKTKINQKQKVLALLVVAPTECKFYFTETYLGNKITSSKNEFVENSRKFLFDFYKNTISLNEVLEKSGAKIVKNKKECDIDLSPEAINKDSILNLI